MAGFAERWADINKDMDAFLLDQVRTNKVDPVNKLKVAGLMIDAYLMDLVNRRADFKRIGSGRLVRFCDDEIKRFKDLKSLLEGA